jgi:hypothetical protein
VNYEFNSLYDSNPPFGYYPGINSTIMSWKWSTVDNFRNILRSKKLHYLIKIQYEQTINISWNFAGAKIAK